jgi:translation elongation factor EF-G
VDGKDIAFVTAGRKATVEAIRAANPIVLEPIVSIEIVAPEAAIGDLTGDLSSRRGHITGTNPRPGNTASITGEVPLAEITDYASRLKSMTGGQGSYSIEFAAMRKCRRRCSRNWRRASSSRTRTNRAVFGADRSRRWRNGAWIRPGAIRAVQTTARRRRKALVMTETELKLIASAAISGDSNSRTNG